MATPRRVITKQLGNLLVERRVITAAQLADALAVQTQQGGLLGQVIVERGFATDEDITLAVATQYGLPYLSLKSYVLDPAILKLVPAALASQHAIIPLDRIDDLLTLAVADPFHRQPIHELETMHHCTAELFVSTLGDILQVIKRYYTAPPSSAGGAAP